MTLLTNSFEGGTTTTTITTGNSGGASGNAFDVMSGTGCTFDSTHTAHGSMAMHAANGFCEWTTSMGTLTTVWYRLYLYVAATPTANGVVFEAVATSTLTAEIVLSTTRTLALQIFGGTVVHTMTTLVPLNQWIRLEGFFTGSTTVGQVSLSMYLTMDSTTADESFTSAASLNTKGAPTVYEFGSSSASCPVWQDDIGLSSTGLIGPAAGAAVPQFLFDTQQAVMTAATR